jgi:hypothetical protein
LDIAGVLLPVSALVIWVALAPFLLAQQAGLPVVRIGLLFLTVIEWRRKEKLAAINAPTAVGVHLDAPGLDMYRHC